MWVSTEAARKAANGTHIAVRIDNLQYAENTAASSLTGETVVPSDYIHMAQANGTPNPITFNDLRRKLGGIAKQEAPGYSGNGPDLHAPMPDVWAADVLTLLNVIQHSGVTPHAWHVDLMHYAHKGGDDSSLSNHRPLTLVGVLRKVFSSVPTSRMRDPFEKVVSMYFLKVKSIRVQEHFR